MSLVLLTLVLLTLVLLTLVFAGTSANLFVEQKLYIIIARIWSEMSESVVRSSSHLASTKP